MANLWVVEKKERRSKTWKAIDVFWTKARAKDYMKERSLLIAYLGVGLRVVKYIRKEE